MITYHLYVADVHQENPIVLTTLSDPRLDVLIEEQRRKYFINWQNNNLIVVIAELQFYDLSRLSAEVTGEPGDPYT